MTRSGAGLPRRGEAHASTVPAEFVAGTSSWGEAYASTDQRQAVGVAQSVPTTLDLG